MNGTEDVKGNVLWKEKLVLAKMLFERWESVPTVSH